MARCLRCKAGNEWIEGEAPEQKQEPNEQTAVREAEIGALEQAAEVCRERAERHTETAATFRVGGSDRDFYYGLSSEARACAVAIRSLVQSQTAVAVSHAGQKDKR